MREYLNYLKRNKYSENTIKTYGSILNIYRNDFKNIRLIKKRLIYYFKNPNTVWTHYNVICSYLKWTKDKRLDSLKEIKLPKIPKKFMVVFTKKFLLNKTEVKNSDNLETINKKMLIKFLFETGLRSCELKQIILINKKTITVIGKGNKIREVFHNFETTKKLKIKNVTTKTIRLWTKDILGKKYTPHSIRRSHATHLLLKGANPKMVMMQLGHEKIETTFRYLQLSIEQNKKIYDKFY
ncbi:MAG: tyrosine-type recombinase/integrase [Spiroplasma sp.]